MLHQNFILVTLGRARGARYRQLRPRRGVPRMCHGRTLPQRFASRWMKTFSEICTCNRQMHSRSVAGSMRYRSLGWARGPSSPLPSTTTHCNLQGGWGKCMHQLTLTPMMALSRMISDCGERGDPLDFGRSGTNSQFLRWFWAFSKPRPAARGGMRYVMGCALFFLFEITMKRNIHSSRTVKVPK